MSICNCGRKTNDKAGICTICKMDGENNDIKEEVMGKDAEKGLVEGRPVYKTCKASGCGKYRVRKGFCTAHSKQLKAPELPEIKTKAAVKPPASKGMLDVLTVRKLALELDLGRINIAIDVLRELSAS